MALLTPRFYHRKRGRRALHSSTALGLEVGPQSVHSLSVISRKLQEASPQGS
jgi:hypothetical protein